MKTVYLEWIVSVVMVMNVWAAPSENPPNVLFIAVDDLKPMLGCYGDGLVKSPNVDRLANGGTVFLNNHCQWPVCGASRVSIMTGLMPEETGGSGFSSMRGKLPDLITLPQNFRDNGYETAAVGKLNDPRTVGVLNKKNPSGKTKGGSKTDDLSSWSVPYAQPVGDNFYTSPTQRSCEGPDLADSKFFDGGVALKGVELLKELSAKEKPFFLAVGFKKPHVPWYAPKKYWDLYDRSSFEIASFQTLPIGASEQACRKGTEVNCLSDTPKPYKNPENGAMVYPELSEEKQLELIHSYYACVSFIDAQIGRVLDELDALGLADNTIVVFWGDHGYHLGDHGRWGKHTLYEQSTRSPLIIKAPNVGPQVKETMSPSGHIDMYRTLCELAGIAVPEQPARDGEAGGRPVRGVSLVPVMTGEKEAVREGVLTHRSPGYSYRTDRYRYIEIVRGGSVSDRDLFDYKTDPEETVDLAEDPEYSDRMKEFSKKMRETSEAAGCPNLLKAAE